MVVAIDGPAGAGKSSVARAVAAELGFTFLDTGAMYRCVALAGGDPVRAAREARIELGDRVRLDGRDVTEAIRAPEVGRRASEVAAIPEVRAAVVARQREIVARGDWVAEGRDIGTVVTPDAEVKVFLTASEPERARRRAAQTGRALEEVLPELRERDARDAGRAASPLRPAPDAVVLDSTELAEDEVVGRIVELVRLAP
jgi:cytidylate kinase